METLSPGQVPNSVGWGRSKGEASPRDGVVRRGVESDPPRVRAQGSQVPLRLFRLLRGAHLLSGVVGTRGGGSSTSMLSHPPLRQSPRLFGDSALRQTRRVRSRLFWERGRQQAQRGLWVRLPARQSPAGSEVGRWARERLRCGDWDLWLRNQHACLPRAPPGLLERCLIQFLEREVEVARDLRQP